ncbi:MAG: TetR family transcriptional regulator [Aliidongia sp.]
MRDQLLAAAGAVMTEQDTIDVSLADIAARAGVNVALVSYYFGGKDGLLLALAKRDAEQALAGLAILMGLDLSPAAKLRKHIAGIVRGFFRHPYLNRLLRALMRDSDSAAAREIAQCFAAPIAEALRSLLSEGARIGELRPLDPMLFHFALLGACESLFSGRTVLKHVHGIEAIDEALQQRYADLVVDLLIADVLPRCLKRKHHDRSLRAAHSRGDRCRSGRPGRLCRSAHP